MMGDHFHGGWYGLIAACAFMVGIGHFGPKLYYQYMPYSHWVEYHSVTPILPFDAETGEYQAKIGGKLYFKSHRTVNKLAFMNWHDALRCGTENGYFPVYSEQDFSRMLDEKDLGEHRAIWPYLSATPDEETTCFITNTIEQHHDRNVVKQQHLTERKYIRFRK